MASTQGSKCRLRLSTAGGAAWLLLLYCVAILSASISAQQAPAPEQQAAVKVYVYELPEALLPADAGGMPLQVARDIQDSEYHTADGEEADYFLIPGTGHYPNGQVSLLQTFDYVRQAFPFWNRTREAGQARHILITQSDHGPGAAAFERPIYVGNGVPDDINPASLTRNVLFLSMNGLRDVPQKPGDSCSTCFQTGKDIMYPTPEMICGPLCGYSLEDLRQKSMFSALEDKDLQAEVTRKRKYRLFYAGTIPNADPTDYTGRGGLYHHHVNRSGYLVLRSGESERVSFPDAMRDADFCFSPMGQSGGDTDRYVAAIMFGCIPIMLNSSHNHMAVPHALPFEEVLHWERFATIVNTKDLRRLDEQLRCLEPYVPMMRLALRDVWQHLLWSTAYNRSYLGENKKQDAMHTLMQVLAQRKAHGYQPSKLTLERLAHHAWRFPCTGRPARLHWPLSAWQEGQGSPHSSGGGEMRPHQPHDPAQRHHQRHVSHSGALTKLRRLLQRPWPWS